MIERYSQNALHKSTTLNHHAMIKKSHSSSFVTESYLDNSGELAAQASGEEGGGSGVAAVAGGGKDEDAEGASSLPRSWPAAARVGVLLSRRRAAHSSQLAVREIPINDT
jgi:hypothetical protein